MASLYPTAAMEDGESINLFRSFMVTEPFGRSPYSNQMGTLDLESMLATLQLSLEYFSKQERTRTVERIRLEMTRISIFHHRWSTALQDLVLLWQGLSWRNSGWFSLLEEVGWMLRECAVRTADAKTLVAVEWELLCRCKQDKGIRNFLIS